VSHRDKRVRLKTANLLALVWELNSTTQLLEQLRVEEDSDVRHGLFVALGNVCYYASLPTSGVKIPDDVRRRTLELAVRFLELPDAEKVRSGADVVWRLLEQDGLSPEEIDKYLTALANRYAHQSGGKPRVRGSCWAPWRGCVRSEASAGSRPPRCTARFRPGSGR
jgi:hypothetical protein